MYNNNGKYNNNNNRNSNNNIGALYKLVSKDGKTYLKGKINGEDVVIYANTFKKEAKHPDYIVLKSVSNNSNNNNSKKKTGYNNNNYNGYNSNNGYNSGYSKGNTNYGGGYNNGGIENIIEEESGLNGIDF